MEPQATTTATCEACGAAFEISPERLAHIASKGYFSPRSCDQCLSRWRAEADADSGRPCKVCGFLFVVSAEERGWFARKGFTLPNRCKPCRVALKKGA